MISKLIFPILLIFVIGCIHTKDSEAYSKNNRVPSKYDTLEIDSICFKKFYKSINTFLNPDRSVINVFDEELVPCCMQLIASGDTTAKNVLYERISKRIEKFKQGDSDYMSIYKIIPETLGALPEPKSLELCMELFENNDIQTYGGICFQLGFSVFKNAILKIINFEKAEEYKNLSAQNYREAIAKGLGECDTKAYVVTHLYPIVADDMLKGNLKLRELQK